MKKKLIVLSGFVMAASPLVAFAQTPVASTCAANANTGTIETIICRLGSILNTIIPFLIVLAVIYFVWGVITYMFSGDDEAKKKGREMIIYGIIGLAVIIGLWGLVGILTRTFGLNGAQEINVPCIVGTPGC